MPLFLTVVIPKLTKPLLSLGVECVSAPIPTGGVPLQMSGSSGSRNGKFNDTIKVDNQSELVI